MKSAYELAMEKLRETDESPRVPLSDEQKAELAGIDRKYDAKLAEKEVFLQPKIDAARRQGDHGSVEQLETQLRNERDRLNEEREFAKNKIRNTPGPQV